MSAQEIDWSSSDNIVLLNPRMPVEENSRLMQVLQEINGFQGHVWLTTSGSSGKLKLVALSKKAILASAKAVDAHLQSDSSDIWLNPLPYFHVGGLGIAARCELSGAKLFEYDGGGRWDPKQFVDQLKAVKATLTSLVPTQVFDLVRQQISPPETLRAVIVGGGALSPELYAAAVKSGWKLLPSYGMTECASQIATAQLECWRESDFPLLVPLDHMSLKLDGEGFLQIKSPALLSAYVYVEGLKLVDPKVEGWFTTEDKVLLEDGKLSGVIRGEHFVKIGGENVDLLRLEKILERILLLGGVACDAALLAMADERLGHVIHLVVAESTCGVVEMLVEEFQNCVFPFERIRKVHVVKEIPRSPLKKVLKNELQSLLKIAVA